MEKSKKWGSIILHLYILFCGVILVLQFIVNGLNAEDLKALEPYDMDVLFLDLSNIHNWSMNILFAFFICIILGSLPFWKKGNMVLQLVSICFMVYCFCKIMYCKTSIIETMSDRLNQLDFVSKKTNTLIDGIPHDALIMIGLSVILLLLYYINYKVSKK